MGLFKKLKKAFKRTAVAVATGGISEAVRGARDLPGALKDGKLPLVGTGIAGIGIGVGSAAFGIRGSGGPNTPGISGALGQASIDEAAAKADREERVRRARTALRGGTIKTGILGAPLAGVALTRPKLG